MAVLGTDGQVWRTLSTPSPYILPFPPSSFLPSSFFPLCFFLRLQAHWARCQMAIRWKASGSLLSSQKRLLQGQMRAQLPWSRQWWEIQQTAEVQTEGTWVWGSWRTPRSRRPPRKGRRQHGLSSSVRGSPPFPLS